MALNLLTIGANLVAILIITLVALSIRKGAPPVPTSRRALATMIMLAQPKPKEKAVDLGSGNGKIILTLAQLKIEAHGYEINPFLVWWTTYRIKKLKVQQYAFAHLQSFWNVPLGDFDMVFVYGMPHIMKALEYKFQKELKPGSRIVSNSFPLPTWKPVKKIENVYLYVR